MDIELVKRCLQGTGIEVSEIIDNTTASETYIRTKFTQDDGFSWETVVPFYIRRSGLFLDDEQELAAYLTSIKPYFQKSEMEKWKKRERAKWEKGNADVTKEL